jgi:ketosteroid isomerase-like protein
MSPENVELVRAAHRAWNAGDMDAAGELYDPDVIMRMAEGWPEPGPFVGRDAVIGQLRRMRETLEGGVVEPISDYIDIADRVVVRLVWRGAGRGPQVNMEGTTVNTVRNGKVREVEWFWDHAEALEAVGLAD